MRSDTAVASETSGTTGTDHNWGMRTMRPRGSNVRRVPIQTRQWLSMLYMWAKSVANLIIEMQIYH